MSTGSLNTKKSSNGFVAEYLIWAYRNAWTHWFLFFGWKKLQKANKFKFSNFHDL
jgi:hypothetical protein